MIRGADSLTPEEKLLHVIEKPDDIDGLRLSKKRNLGKNIRFRKISLAEVNKALLWVTATAVVVLIFYFIGEDRNMRKRFAALKVKVEKNVFHISAKEDVVPKLSEYLLESGKNNPFDVLPTADTVKAKKSAKEEKAPLKLVGIIWSDMPQAIIEDEGTKQNYLVSKGGRIDKFTIKEITQEEVQLTSADGDETLK